MLREELLRNEGYWMAKIQLDLFNQLTNYLKQNNINQSQFAEKLGVSKGYVSQILNGDFNHRISKFVELALAMDKIPEINFRDLTKAVKDVKDGYITIKWDVDIKKAETISSLSQESEKFEKTIKLVQKVDTPESYPVAV